MNNLKFLTGICLTALLLLSACSSDEPNTPQTEFKTTARVLNKHLDNNQDRLPDSHWKGLVAVAKDCPDTELLLNAEIDVMEIPARGGTYDFKFLRLSKLQNLSIYGNVPLMEHFKLFEDTYSHINGEYLAYDALIGLRDSADASSNFRDLSNKDKTEYGIFENANPDEEIESFTYTFPENHSGKYRLFIFAYTCTIFDMVAPTPTNVRTITTSNYFIQMPD